VGRPVFLVGIGHRRKNFSRPKPRKVFPALTDPDAMAAQLAGFGERRAGSAIAAKTFRVMSRKQYFPR